MSEVAPAARASARVAPSRTPRRATRRSSGSAARRRARACRRGTRGTPRCAFRRRAPARRRGGSPGRPRAGRRTGSRARPGRRRRRPPPPRARASRASPSGRRRAASSPVEPAREERRVGARRLVRGACRGGPSRVKPAARARGSSARSRRGRRLRRRRCRAVHVVRERHGPRASRCRVRGPPDEAASSRSRSAVAGSSKWCSVSPPSDLAARPSSIRYGRQQPALGTSPGRFVAARTRASSASVNGGSPASPPTAGSRNAGAIASTSLEQEAQPDRASSSTSEQPPRRRRQAHRASTCARSLSPRPERQTTIRSASRSSARASACDGSSAGTIPSVRASRWNAVERFLVGARRRRSARPLSRRSACSGPTPG